MLRNLDVLTNEEGVLTVMQEVIPTLVSKISKILICRDPLTSTSRGICYLVFENLVDSMNTHNALKSLEPPLSIDGREINISYCVDVESRQLHGRSNGNKGHDGNYGGKGSSNYQYTLNDVPRLAEYSAGVYAQTKAEHDFYFKYYTDYYTEQINNGLFADLPTMSQIGGTANSGAAVALSAIQRKQKQQFNNKATVAPTPASPTQIPNGDVTKKYRKYSTRLSPSGKKLIENFISFVEQHRQTQHNISTKSHLAITSIRALVFTTTLARSIITTVKSPLICIGIRRSAHICLHRQTRHRRQWQKERTLLIR